MSKQDIESLEKGLNFFNKLKINNEPTASGEPVAWTDGRGNYFDKNSFFPVDDLIPLYTHPAKTLTGAVGSLSDEEIIKLMIPRMKQILEILFNEGWLDEYR